MTNPYYAAANEMLGRAQDYIADDATELALASVRVAYGYMDLADLDRTPYPVSRIRVAPQAVLDAGGLEKLRELQKCIDDLLGGASA